MAAEYGARGRRVLLLGATLALLVRSGCAPLGDDDGPLTLNPSKTGAGSVGCTLGDGRAGTCVAYTQCYSNFSIIKYGEPDDFEIRRGACPSHREWCCANDILTPEEAGGDARPGQAVPQRAGTEAAQTSAQTTISSVNPADRPTSTESGAQGVQGAQGALCGLPQDGLRRRQDSQLAYGECPWCVAIFRSGGNPRWMNSDGYFCDGSLVHPRAVLTAANCVRSTAGLKMWVRVGDYELSSSKELFPHQELVVDSSAVHPQYNSGSKAFNVALLYLSAAAEIRDNVNTVCLPAGSPAVPACLASGWGRDASGQYVDIPAKIPLTVVNSSACEAAYRDGGASAQFSLPRAALCAESGVRVDTCPLSHGTPMFCAAQSDKSRFVQLGVFSWSVRCGAGTAIPGIYVDLRHVTDWIFSQLKTWNLNTDSSIL